MEVYRTWCVLLTVVVAGTMSQETDVKPVVFINVTDWEGDPCMLPLKESGVCSRLKDCGRLAQAIHTGLQPQICSYDRHISIVCCPLADYQPNVISQKITQIQGAKAKKACDTFKEEVANLTEKYADIGFVHIAVIGGEIAFLGDYPHMAAIGYGEEDDISWLCGGSLISLRFVLTAGHCLRSSQKGPARWVRLGDLNLVTDLDNKTTQQLSVTERIPHPDYRPPSHYNDVGLLRLDRDMTWEESVRPACLHMDETINLPSATGWGLTDWVADTGSADLMTVSLDVQPPELCEEEYRSLVGTRRLRTGFDNDSMLCVGNLEGGKDTCKGDSGGPFQMNLGNIQFKLHSIIGVTSFGLSVCGAKNSPAVYSRVSHFVPWIESIVWP